MTPLNIAGIKNGYKVDGIVSRGAQPEDSAWPLLKAAGFGCVIDLNSTGAALAEQHKLSLEVGLPLIALDWSGIVPPSTNKIRLALDFIDGSIPDQGMLLGNMSVKAPVYIHCLHGSDRTGTLCACWRMHHDGWDFDAAMKEAFIDLGMQGMHEFWMAAACAHYSSEQGSR